LGWRWRVGGRKGDPAASLPRSPGSIESDVVGDVFNGASGTIYRIEQGERLLKVQGVERHSQEELYSARITQEARLLDIELDFGRAHSCLGQEENDEVALRHLRLTYHVYVMLIFSLEIGVVERIIDGCVTAGNDRWMPGDELGQLPGEWQIFRRATDVYAHDAPPVCGTYMRT
jgi:hypothetical protein